MKRHLFILLAALCASASAQMPMPNPEPSIKRPSDPGMQAPGSNGSVVVPPATGNEEIAKKPKNVDPKIDDATGDIDRKNLEKSEEKSGKR